MPVIQLNIFLNEKLALKSVSIEHNDTGLASDSGLIQKVAYTLLKGLHLNKDDVQVQDLLNELGIERERVFK